MVLVSPWKSLISDGKVFEILKQRQELYDKEPNARLNRLIGYINRFRDAVTYSEFKEKGSNRRWRNRKCSQIRATEKVENSRCDLEPYTGRSYACTESLKGR